MRLYLAKLNELQNRLFVILQFVWCGASFARRPAFAQHCARESNSERELAQVESTVCFQRKLSSERVTRASVPSLLAILFYVAVRDRNYLSRSATLLYFIWSSGQVVKFSFLFTFLRK